MDIRLCTLEDKEKWIELNLKFMKFELIDEEFWNHANSFSKDTFSKTFQQAFENPELITLMIIEENGKPIGFVNLMTIFSIWSHGKALILDDLYLEEEYQRRGLGRKVMESIEKYARLNGYKRLQFQSEVTNPGANNFYKTLGYESTDMYFYVKYFNENKS